MSMKQSRWVFVAGFLTWSCTVASGQTQPEAPSQAFQDWAATPPMGWNSWDSYGAGVGQDDALANADYMAQNLKSHGWNIITIDIQWYEPLAHTTEYRKGAALEMDANGRLLPAPNRFPLTRESRSFKPIADYLHAKGLKFGLHLMRGIPRQAVDRDNVPILGTNLHAADIVDRVNYCQWNTDMWGIDMSKPGAQEYYNSVFAMLASWDLDFVKVDDLTGHLPEIEAIRKAIDETGRPIVLSISPGPSRTSDGAFLATHANMWRISGDFWDSWGALYSQFANTDSWTPFRGAGHWPDADMLPLGNVRAWQRKDNWTHFTHDEQYTLMTLWSIARSPLIMGGNMPMNDEFTLSLMTNDEVIAVDQHSAKNKQVWNRNNHVVWEADAPDSPDKYVAIFNASPAPVAGRHRGGPATGPAPTAVAITPAATQPACISVLLTDLGLIGPCKVRDLWVQKDLGTVTTEISAMINSHGAVLYRVQPVK